MTTAYTSLLGLALPVTGELSGTWGDTVNNSITSLLDSAIAGTTTITVDADTTLSITQGSANTARMAILLWTAGGTATRTIFAPNQSKIYTVINASSSTQSIILAGVSPVTTGVTIAKGESALCAWNGSDFIKISNTAGPGTFTNLTVTGNTSLGDADTDTITQAASYVTGTQLKSAKTATNTLSLAAYDVDGTAYTNLITLTASNTPTLALTSTGVGTINNMSIGATTASTGAFTTLSATDVIKQTGNPSLAAAGATEAFVAHNTGYGAVLYGQGTTYDVALLDRNTTPRLTVTTTAVAVTGTLSATGNLTSPTLQLGTNPAGVSIGVLGIPNQKRVYGRNAANSADVNILYVDGSNGLVFGPSDAAVIDSSGNLGIGTTSPSTYSAYTKLSVLNGIAIATNTTDGGVLVGATTTGTELAYLSMGRAYNLGSTGEIVLATNGAKPILFGTSNTERMRITDTSLYTASNINVGIGTSSPSAKLHIYKSSLPAELRIQSGDTQPTISFYSDAVQTPTRNWAISSSFAAYGDLCFLQSTALGGNPITAGTTRMTLDASGNLGLGPLATNFTFTNGSAVSIAGSGTGIAGNGTNLTLGVWNGPIIFQAGNSAGALVERARIDSSGNFQLGAVNDGVTKSFTVYQGGGAEGTVYGTFIRTNGGSSSLEIQNANDFFANAANAACRMGRNSVNSRSLNAGGTVNASGADYAEYMTKAGDFTIAKGDVVGVDAQGKLTNVFTNAISFVVKSTDPSYVGGDSWGSEDALGLSMPEKPSQRQATEEIEAETDEDFEIRLDQYEADQSAFDAALEAARQLVDRIAFAGQVPVNVTGATAGQYIIPVNNNGAIKGEAINEADMTLAQYMKAVGKVIAIELDGRAKIIVKVA